MGQIACKKGDFYKSDDVNRPAGERWITMNNALTRASHGLTLAEKRIIMAAVSKLDSTRPLPPGEVPTTRITAGEFSELYGVSLDTAYDQLQDAAKHLYGRSITFFEPAERRRGKALEPTLVTMRWVGQVHYQKGEGWVELYWWPKLLPSLVGLKKQFTSYQLQQVNGLRSTYSWKLLELLMRFKSSGNAEYAIEDFATAMGATDKQSADFAAIRRKIIEPAVKELVEKQGWEIQWRAIKAGRKVQSLRFDFLPAGLSAELLAPPVGIPRVAPVPSPAPGEDINDEESNVCPACGVGHRLEGFAFCKTCTDELSD